MYTVTPGNGSIVFEDVTIPKLGSDQALQVECFSPAYNTITGQSNPFIAYDFPRTGLLRRTAAKILFTGPYDLVEAAIVAYNELGLHGKATCTGCPPGVLPKVMITMSTAHTTMNTRWMMIRNTCTLVRRRRMTAQGMFTGIIMSSFLMEGCSVLTTM